MSRKPTNADNAPSFEEAMTRLDEIVEAMDEERMPLESMVQFYEEGVRLLSQCRQQIDNARQRVERINVLLESGGVENAELQPFDPASSTEADEAAAPLNKPKKSRTSSSDDPDSGADEIRLF